MSRKNKSLVLAVPLNFLLGCSETDLGSFELARLSAVANLRSQLHQILDRTIDEMSKATLAAWFKATDRQTLKRALDSQEDVMAWARERIRNGQRSDAEIVPRPLLPPGEAHLASALLYAERNIAEGKCSVCLQPLAHNSVRYCETHLALARERMRRKKARQRA